MPKKPFSWKIAGKLMNPPDRDGEVFWIVEIDVKSGFPGYSRMGHPTVQFMAGTKAEHWIDSGARGVLEAPIYRYSVEVTFRSLWGRDRHLSVTRCWDAQGRFCRINTRNSQYVPGPHEETYLRGPLEEGIWQAIIFGEAKDQLHLYGELWKNIAPFLLEMSHAPEMQKMERLYFANVEHEELHTDVGGYDESGLSFLLTKEENLLTEMARWNTPSFQKLPPGTKIPKPDDVGITLKDFKELRAGDIFDYFIPWNPSGYNVMYGGRYTVTGRSRKKGGIVLARKEGEDLQEPTAFSEKSIPFMRLFSVEHHELHTDVGVYDE